MQTGGVHGLHPGAADHRIHVITTDAEDPLGLERYARGLPLVRALAGFNLGVELGQAIAIGLVLPIMFMIGRLARAVLVYRYASLAVAAAGAYWLAERLHLG
jgi:hypothetical protein